MGGDRQKARELIERNNLWPDVTPQERRLLEAAQTDPDLGRGLLWRLEGLWGKLGEIGDALDNSICQKGKG
jgi:hypothetical protein